MPRYFTLLVISLVCIAAFPVGLWYVILSPVGSSQAQWVMAGCLAIAYIGIGLFMLHSRLDARYRLKMMFPR